MKKAERTEKIRELAEEFARSGECQDWQSVESKLRLKGWDEAGEVLHNRHLRDYLDEICSIAQKSKKKNAEKDSINGQMKS